MNSDSEEEEELPYAIGEAASEGDFERVKAWLAGGSESAPRSVNSSDDTDWTLLHWTTTSDQLTPEHVEFVRYLISQGVRVNAPSLSTKKTALHYACDNTSADMVSVLVAAGAAVNQLSHYNLTPLLCIDLFCEATLDIVTILLRAGASLDSSTRSFEEHLDGLEDDDPDPDQLEHVRAIRPLVASVRAAGSWKAHCISPHKEVLRLRSLVARGRVKLPRTRRPRGRDARQKRALEFVVRQGDNGIVWHILSFWRATA